MGHYSSEASSYSEANLKAMRTRESLLCAALRQIEERAEAAIYKYGITQEPPGPPEAWVTRINAVLESVAPIRDMARKALRDAGA